MLELGWASPLVGIALIGWTIYRQFTARPVGALWLAAVPLLLLYFAGQQLTPAMVGTPGAAVYLVVSLAAAVALGLVRGAATVLWRAADGRVWRRGTRQLAALWGLSIALRIALGFVAGPLGVPAAAALSEVTLFSALTLAAQNGLVAWRAWGSVL